MRAVNIYATRTALTEWAGQGYVNKVDGVSLDPRIESFGSNTRLAIEVQRYGSYLTTIYAYATTATRNADTGRDVNVGSIVYGETSGPLAFWSGSAWTVDGFSVATALRAALSGFASSLIIADGVPIPGPPGTTEFSDLEGLPDTLAGYGIGDAVKAVELAAVVMPPRVSGAVARSLGSKLAEVISIEDFGARGDGADDSDAFLEANEWLAGGYGRSLYLPRYYETASTLVLGPAGHLFGDDRAFSGIKWIGGDLPIVARLGWEDPDSEGIPHASIRGLRFDDTALVRTQNWALDFGNSPYPRFENIWVQTENASSKASSGRFGLLTGRVPGSSFSGLTFVPKIRDSRFSGAKLLINTTDYYVNMCELWAVGRDYALQVNGGGSVSDCQLVGGQDFGALYVNAPGESLETLRVIGNYFDGSYNELDTRSGMKISAGTRVNRAILALNTFWRQNREGLSCEGILSQSKLFGNVFDNCDSGDGGFDDIYIATSDNNSFNNQHYRQDVAPKTGATRINLGSPIVIGGSGLPTNVENVVSSQVDAAFYRDAIYAAGVKVDVVLSSRKFGKASGEVLSIFDNSVSGNYNIFKNSGVYYFSNGPACTNGPTLAAGELAVKLEVNSLSAGYTMQELTLPKSGKKWTRMEENAVWSTWQPV